MLKLFFSIALPEQRISILRGMQARSKRKLAQLNAIEHDKSADPTEGPYLTLALGMELTKTYLEWCEATERRLAKE
jgi:hypothetical protein